MKDKWMNIGFEEDELKPYTEPMPDLNDQMRIGKLYFININFSDYKEKKNFNLFIIKINLNLNYINNKKKQPKRFHDKRVIF